MIPRLEKLTHLSMCIATGIERLDNAHKLFDHATAEVSKFIVEVRLAEVRRDEAFKVLDVVRADLRAWLAELERLL